MVKTLKVSKKDGQKVIGILRKKGWLNPKYRLGKTKLYLIIPLKGSISSAAAKLGKIEEKNLETHKASGGLKEKLASVIPKIYLNKVNKSFDTVGTIAILDIPKGLEKLEKSIAWTLLRTTPYIKTVAKRASVTKGTFRVRKVKVLVGDRTTETTHLESGVRLKLDLNKVYFSPRWVTERRRIANLVAPKEKVLVMFAGVGPFGLVINKIQPKVGKVVSVEINSSACKYLAENIRKNCGIYAKGRKPAIATMLAKHKSICGDVTEVVPSLGKFDRVIMPLPQTAIKFLELAIKASKKGGMIHLYAFAHDNDLASLKRKISKYPVRLVKTIVCGAYAPGVDRYCFDLKVK